jgi:recombinational DNA repair protein (RecF pathway)
MHHIHRTKAFVVKSYPAKEADKSLLLLTEEMGMIRAISQGSRKAESKMRQSIQDYSLLDAALVSGRAGWRLVNAAPVESFYKNISNKDLKNSICRQFSLINRLVAGEDGDPRTFPVVNSFVTFAMSKEEIVSTTDELVKTFEILFTASVLNALGYLAEGSFDSYIYDDVSVENIKKLSGEDIKVREKLVAEINRAIRDSSL